ncbi:MAG: AMP-binding protein, partial [Myxococcota bacterium]
MSALFPRLESAGDEVVLRVGEESVSAKELAAASAALTARLAAHGVRRGARVAVWTQPSLETLVALVAGAH